MAVQRSSETTHRIPHNRPITRASYPATVATAPHSGHLCGVTLMSYPHTLHLPSPRPRLLHHLLQNKNPIAPKNNTKNQCGTFTYLPPCSGQITSVPNPKTLLLYLVP